MTEQSPEVTVAPAKRTFLTPKREFALGVAVTLAAVAGIVLLRGRVDDHIAEVAENSHSTV